MNSLSIRSLDQTTKAWLDHFTVQPAGYQAIAYDRFIRAAKECYFLNNMDAMQLLLASDADGSRMNIVDPTKYPIVKTNSPIHTPDVGWTAISGLAFISTENVQLGANNLMLSQNSNTLGVGVMTDTASDTSAAAYGNNLRLNPRTLAGLFSARISNASPTTVANTNGKGLFAGSRRNSNNLATFMNGTVNNFVQASMSIAGQTTIRWPQSSVFTQPLSIVFFGGQTSDVQQQIVARAYSQLLIDLGQA